jgi:hypothetical protein
VSVRQCPYCGKAIPAQVRECPYCDATLRAYMPDISRSSRSGQVRRLLRRGTLWMLLAVVVYYFAAGYSPWDFPFSFAPMLVDWVLPLLFLAGFGQAAYGLYRHFVG